MNRFRHLVLPSVLTVLLFVLSASAFARREPKVQGEYSGDGMTLVLRATDNPDPQFEGLIRLSGDEYPFTANFQDDAIRGSFKVGKDAFPFVMTRDGEKFTFDTQGSRYALQRTVKPQNPLENAGEAKPKNPLEKHGTNPVPGPGGQGGVGGLGVQFDNNNPDKKWRVTALMPGGPAAEAGVTVGETIIAIDGKPVEGMTMEQIGALIRGSIGSTVKFATRQDFPGGGSAESEREIQRGDLRGGAGRANPGGAGADLKPYAHASGLWNLAAPGGDWKLEETPDGTTTKWTHPSGALIFVTLAPNAPFKDGETFFKQGMAPAWQQSGVRVSNETRYEVAGAPGYLAQFSRNRNGVDEYGQVSLFVVNGTGIIFQLSLPQSAAEQLNGTFDQVARSFKVTPR
ncbi:hypothetical protein BH09PLA1_BH09PLA1_30140 [soil metagenome]